MSPAADRQMRLQARLGPEAVALSRLKQGFDSPRERQQNQCFTIYSAQTFKVFFNFSSTRFSRVMTSLTLEETARILCEPDAYYSEFERAILLFGLQVSTVSPTVPQVASNARLGAEAIPTPQWRLGVISNTTFPVIVFAAGVESWTPATISFT
jgi:hypothetical protein